MTPRNHDPDVPPTLGHIVRPAQATDIPALAELLVQLYAVELPGALTGAPAAQRGLLRFTLEAQPAQALTHRYVLCDAANQVRATGMLQFPTGPSFERAPAGTLRMATALLGVQAVAPLLLTVARSMIGVYRQRRADTALLHSVVVDEACRGRGFGRTLLDALEGHAAEKGYQWASVQVLAANHPARQLYLHRGYQDIWRSPRWMSVASWPSYVMRKALRA